MDIPLALTYDDVLLVPQKSSIKSRRDVDTSTRLTKNISLKIPIISANMDTVTESRMAIAMARAGGVGIIHRFLSIEEQVEEIKKVKRKQNIIIEEPYTVSKNLAIKELWKKITKHNCYSFLVADENNHLLGIITKRDITFAENGKNTVADLMTPREKLIVGNPSIYIQDAKRILHKNRIEKLPLVDGNNYIKGLITSTDILKAHDDIATKDDKGQLRVGAAIGVKKDYLERSQEVIKAGTSVLTMDIAHGHSEQVLQAIKEIKKKFPNIEIIGGNIATKEGAEDLIKAGVDAVKVGIGAGAACITRIKAGVGVPQLSALMSIRQACQKADVPMIADGGIRHPGDMVKALAAGAETVMLGSQLSGTKETPGPVLTYQNQRYKIYRGMASLTANISRPDKNKNETINAITPEGVESRVVYRGSVENVLFQFIGGLRSGMSYNNAITIPDLQKNARFVRITSAGLSESFNHSNKVL